MQTTGGDLAILPYMPRCPRVFVPGLSHHVIQRGNNRGALFKAPHDCRFYLELLGNASRRCGDDIHGYVLMTNHAHLIATASTATALPQMMKRLGEVYVQSFNKQYDRTGTLCEGRYRASLIGDEHYWLTCLRYIELNPVRAGLVSSPELYPWSSYRAHAFGRHDPVLTPHPLFLALGQTAAERQAAWQTTCGAPVGADALVTIRRAIHSCRPLKDVLAKEDPQTEVRVVQSRV